MQEAHVNPDPNEANATMSPLDILSSFKASENAIGIDAAVVFPYLLIFEKEAKVLPFFVKKE